MQNAGIKMNYGIRKNYTKYILPSNVLINPYIDPKFDFKDIEVEQHKIEHLKQDIQHKQFDVGWHKLFDDASLAYDCHRTYFLDIAKLDISNSQITENGIGDLTRSPYSENLERIDFSKNPSNVTDLTLRYLADSSTLNKLQIIILTGTLQQQQYSLLDTSVTDIGMMYLFEPYNQEVELLSSGEQFRQTRRTFAKKVVEASSVISGGFKTTYEFLSTEVNTNEDLPLDEEISSRILHNKLPMLSTLVLSGNDGISDQTLKYLSYSTSIQNLKSLDLKWTRITDNGLIEYLNSPNSSNLQLLDVSYQHEKVTSAFLSAFALSKYCKNMAVLICRNCDISDNGISDLIESENTHFIEELDFSRFEDQYKRSNIKRIRKVQISQMKTNQGLGEEENPECITDKGLRKLGNAKYLGSIKRLSMMGQEISEQALIDFMQSDTFRTLQELNISKNIRITDQVLMKITTSEKSKELQKLIITDTAITEDGIATFKKIKQNVEIIHSIQFTSEIRKIARLNREGITVFICDDDNCSDTIDPKLCYTCPMQKDKKNKITSKEFPVKLCQICGDDFRITKVKDQIKRKCINCRSTIARYKGFHQLFRCYLCSIGDNRYKCAMCKKPYDEDNTKY